MTFIHKLLGQSNRRQSKWLVFREEEEVRVEAPTESGEADHIGLKKKVLKDDSKSGETWERRAGLHAVRGSPTYPDGQEQIAPWFLACNITWIKSICQILVYCFTWHSAF